MPPDIAHIIDEFLKGTYKLINSIIAESAAMGGLVMIVISICIMFVLYKLIGVLKLRFTSKGKESVVKEYPKEERKRDDAQFSWLKRHIEKIEDKLNEIRRQL